MPSDSLFSKNRDRWVKQAPQYEGLLDAIHPDTLTFCETDRGECNLSTFYDGAVVYFHDPNGAKEEAERWFASLDLEEISLLIVAGLGLGYFYEPVKGWLKEDANRHLVVIEDNLKVIYRFFETKRADAFLRDPQVELIYMRDLEWDILPFPPGAKHLTKKFILGALPYYERKMGPLLTLLQCKALHLVSYSQMLINECESFGSGFFASFYKNVMELPQSYLCHELWGQFKGVPCIICGAGPSLEKNRRLVETLMDKALVLAGGTGLNALNGTKVHPHFAFGIDPNYYQKIRLMMNQAFETPFVYANRLLHDAFKLIGGPKVFLAGIGQIPVSDWIEEELKIVGSPGEDMGMTVTTLNLVLAKLLGCNPIICVGVDLAYSQNASYSKRVRNHALHDWRTDFPTKGFEDELVPVKDVDGKPINTLWKWVHESTWIANFCARNPQLLVINATEGGIGFQGVPNVPLEKLTAEFLDSFDMEARVHGEIRSHPVPPEATVAKVRSLLEELDASFMRCVELCEGILLEYQKVALDLEQGKSPPEDLATDEARSLMERLFEELAYKKVLDPFGSDYIKMRVRDLFPLQRAETEEEVREGQKKKVRLLWEEYAFFSLGSKVSRERIAEALKEYREPEPGLAVPPRYEVKRLAKGEEKVVLTYPTGEKKMTQEFQDKVLHGFSQFFSKEGEVLAKSCYVEGLKEGQALLFYPGGACYAALHYAHGEYEGEQRYYYPGGVLKTELHFSKGLLDGPALLYHPNGKKARELHFSQGEWHGREAWSDEEGNPLLEAEYCQSEPVGVARRWYPGGAQVAEEIHFEGKERRVRRFLPTGEELTRGEYEAKDYFDLLTEKTQELTGHLKHVLDNLRTAANLSPHEEEMQRLLVDVEERWQQLQGMDQEMETELKAPTEQRLEMIWKTPSNQKYVDKYLKEVTQKMNADIESIQGSLGEALKHLGRKPPS